MDPVANGPGPPARARRSLFQPETLVLKLVFIVIAIVVPAWTLWVRQTPDALLRVDSFVGGLEQVMFWALPTFAVFLVVPRTRLPVVLGGLATVVLLTWGWWSSAHDWHSTAGGGAAMIGWFLGPAVVVLSCVISTRFELRRIAPRRNRS
jgi:hypothetical protein